MEGTVGPLNPWFGILRTATWHLVFACRSKHEEIDLVSLEEFYKEAPPDISKAEVTMGDPHQQTLARLDWELEQRKRLCTLLPDLINLCRHRPLAMECFGMTHNQTAKLCGTSRMIYYQIPFCNSHLDQQDCGWGWNCLRLLIFGITFFFLILTLET